jgi:hypothetical protein
MKAFEPDEQELMESLFGKGAEIDPHTGNMVLRNARDSATGS